MHSLAALVALLAVMPLAVSAPVFGFAALTAGLALVQYLLHNNARLRAERSFFSTGAPMGTALVRIRSAAFANALVRALAVGTLALFTFPPLDASEIARSGALAAYGAQIDAERIPTLLIFYLTAAIAIPATLLLGLASRADAERWALYRLALPFGLLFSAMVSLAHVQSDRILAVFPEPPARAGLTLYASPPTLAVLDSVRALHGELSAAERARAMRSRTQQECARDFWLDVNNLRERMNRAAWRCDELREPVDPVPIARSALFTMAIFDDLIDALVADLAGAISGTLSPGGGPVSDTVRGIVGIVFSSNLLQGFVLAVYVAPLTRGAPRLWPGGRRHARDGGGTE